MQLADKVAIVTGGGSGIGEATARRFARAGARIVVVDVDEVAAGRVAAEITAEDGGALAIRADVTQGSEVAHAVEQVVSTFGRIDVLFNNAGVSCVGRLDETPEAEWDHVLQVNVKGIYQVSRYVLPVMMEQRSGSVINMSSAVADIGVAERAAYTASKGAVMSLTRAMQVDYAPYGIRVNALLPGTIYTPFVEGYLQRHFADRRDAAVENLQRRQLTGTLGTPEDVAWAALYLASDEARFVLGSGLAVDGGFASAK